MPREQITFDVETDLLSDDGNPVVEHFNDPTLHVVWKRAEVVDGETHDGWCQVALEPTLGYLEVVTESPNGRIHASENQDANTTYVYSDVLTPDVLDRLIAVLKHAKRKAYGSGLETEPVDKFTLAAAQALTEARYAAEGE